MNNLKEEISENIKELERANWISGCLESHLYTNIDDINAKIKELSNLYDKLTDKAKLTNHKPEYAGIDLTEQVELLRCNVVEKALIVIIDEFEKKIIDWAVVSSGTKNYCYNDDGKYNIIKLFKKHRFKEMLTVVEMHNHPRISVANQSDADKDFSSELSTVCKFFGYKLGDNIVVTKDDIYSRAQNEVLDGALYIVPRDAEMLSKHAIGTAITIRNNFSFKEITAEYLGMSESGKSIKYRVIEEYADYECSHIRPTCFTTIKECQIKDYICGSKVIVHDWSEKEILSKRLNNVEANFDQLKNNIEIYSDNTPSELQKDDVAQYEQLIKDLNSELNKY